MWFHGEKMEDITIVEKILRSMTLKFDYVVCSIEESKDIDGLSLNELQSSLLPSDKDEQSNLLKTRKERPFCNLLSAGQLLENGYLVTLRNGACEISNPSKRVVTSVEMSQNKLFPLKIKAIQSCLMAEVKDSLWQWHFLYGHLNFGGLKILENKNMMIGLPPIISPSLVCEECIALRTDRGGEYCSKAFEDFCNVHNIRRELTTAYTPQQNHYSKTGF
ncbi:Retrovirus-related Pol polyprotein from transposon TNT 1-94 [Gossypium australe]|uniref:Retrovirus-related Pol polyprotein from transposon TNT 1-94 n=1 Tax=Gossypium australe TaxID=47621 RepID=A0A5B6WZ53_9ROSI|nr:Retrovirus-related Pol polyprotein from transposon TNT 1-94 [Gossypium australe]